MFERGMYSFESIVGLFGALPQCGAYFPRSWNRYFKAKGQYGPNDQAQSGCGFEFERRYCVFDEEK